MGASERHRHQAEVVGRYRITGDDDSWSLRSATPSLGFAVELLLVAVLLLSGLTTAVTEPLLAFIAQLLAGTFLMTLALIRESQAALNGHLTPVRRQLTIRDGVLDVDGRALRISDVREVRVVTQLMHTRRGTFTLARVFLDLADEWLDVGNDRDLAVVNRLAAMLRERVGLKGKGPRPFALPPQPGGAALLMALFVILTVFAMFAAPMAMVVLKQGPLGWTASGLVVLGALVAGTKLGARATRGMLRRWFGDVRARAQ